METLSMENMAAKGHAFVKKEPQNDLDTFVIDTESTREHKVKIEYIKQEPFQSLKAQTLTIEDWKKLNQLLKQQQQKPLNYATKPPSKPARKPKLKFRPENGTVLDISNVDLAGPSLEDQIEIEDLSFLHHALKYSKKMVAITGAGISVGSGIPDFRSSNGLFQDLSSKSTGSGKDLFDYNVFRSNESIKSFENMIEKLYWLSNISKPTKFHHLLDTISQQGRMQRLYTQNIDCLDVQLPALQTEVPLTFKMPFPKAVQLHGNIKLMNCSKCNFMTELTPEYFVKKESLMSLSDRNHGLITPCPECEEMNNVRLIAGKRTQSAGILRPRIVLYNEFHPDGEIIGNITESDLKAKPDCMIVVGTTLKIPGVRRLVKEMAKVIHSNNGYVIWINLDEPTQSIVDYVEVFDLIVTGDCQMIPDLIDLYDYQLSQKSTKPKRTYSKKTTSSVRKEPVSGKIEKVQTDEKANKYKNESVATKIENELKVEILSN